VQTVVLTSPSADARARRALARALERWPAIVEEVEPADRGAALKRAASNPGVEWLLVVDPDAVLRPDAFGSLRAVLTENVVLAGGRALIGESQRLGSMFGPSRSGPNPFDLLAVAGPQIDRGLATLSRGPIDAPQRGVIVVAAEFVRGLAQAELDPLLLHLDLAVHARAAGRTVLCEPSLAFEIDEDSRQLRGRLGDLRRYAGAASWLPYQLHRDPPRVRSSFIMREVRIMGNYRGFVRLPLPPIDVVRCDPRDGDALRAALTRTGDRYVLVADAAELPDRAPVESLVERVERNGRVALAVQSATPPFGAALFHCGRIINGASLRGSTVRDVIAGAIESLPRRRLIAATIERDIVPVSVPPVPAPQTLDVVFVSAAKPLVTSQTLQALLSEPVSGKTFAVYPAGAATTERMFSVHANLTLLPDASDVHLAVGLNRALGATSSEAVAILRDDVQIPHGFLARLQDAFARIPRLGAVVPRVGGSDRPEALPEQSYLNSVDMQAAFDRRAEAYAREVMLLDVATTPVIMISREALDVVGGFDETFGFSRLGVEDFTRRLRSANFLVGCCEDAYAHLFAFEDAASYIAGLDGAPYLRTAYETRWAGRNDFDPARDRVPLRTSEPPKATAGDGLRILLPVGNDDEWRTAQRILIDLTQAFRVNDPLEVALGLDGTYGLQTALSAIRELLLASKIPMDETINISIDFVPDMVAWRESGGRRNARVNGIDREALAELPPIDGAHAVRALLEQPGS
jgi:GT2 family glycosyltransferase